MGLREIKAKARGQLHQAMQVSAFYIANPATPLAYIPVKVRVHSKFDALGGVQGVSFNYAERETITPQIVFLYDDVQIPPRGALITVTDPATLAQEAYRVDFSQGRDGLTVTASVTILTPAERVGLPFPEAA